MPNWTTDQQKVIDTRDNNILVSAAAGSGKTAVLVERIINKIINDKVEADELLVVTFTNAAAKEMKVRIRKALDEVIKDEPDNEFLTRQNTLITSADISTIDSYCVNLVKENYNDIGVDPSIRICDESEEVLIFQEAIEKVYDDNFNNEDNEDFINLMNLYTKAGDYSAVNKIIKDLYDRACSYPWPNEWLDNISMPYIVDEDITIGDIKWVRELYDNYIGSLSYIRTEFTEYLSNIKEHLISDKKGNNNLQINIEKGIEYIDLLLESSDMEDLYKHLTELDLKTNKKAKLSKGVAMFNKSVDYAEDSDEAVELFSSYITLCESYHEIYSELERNKIDNILEEIEYVSPYALTLISLTRQVMREFDEIKETQNVATFNDIEHYALNILIDPVTKEVTETAIELQKKYNEVMVDEYQDINDLQEKILVTLSNGANMFMVGDVKQSIYGFRMAKPDIFVNKYHTFLRDESKGISINLKENFRSRREVLDVVNNIFLNIMTKATSGFDYDEKQRLYFGAHELFDDGNECPVEIIIADSKEEDFDSSREVEAAVVAERINELIDNHYQVKDKDENDEVVFRDIRYSDIAIILRAANTNGRVYEKSLLEHNVPCHTSNNKGYFDTIEVRLMLSFLTVIDNPCRDIELTSVLHSPLYNISNDMLAKVKIFSKNNNLDKDNYLYYEIKAYIEAMKDNEEAANSEFEALVYAIDMIDEFRKLVFDTSIHELLEMIYDRTSYLDYVSSLLGGEYKRANLLALIDKALDYEKTNFRGVFRFLRYVESMKEFDLDIGEASISSENDDVVRIITMHKSKGLEFPVVFVSDLGSQMRDMDTNVANIVHNSLGLGMELRREINGNKYKKNTQYKNYIKKIKEKDYMAEEARLLYVATTRAKEKLILTAVLNEPQATIDIYKQGRMNYESMINSKNRMEWIIRGINTSDAESLASMISYRSPENEVVKTIIEYSYIFDKKEAFNRCMGNVPASLKNLVDERLSFEYPYEIDDNIKAKYSVSDIKHSAMEEAFEEETEARPEFLNEEKEATVPDFISKKSDDTVNVGALYGTAMHRVMECYDFEREDYDSSLDEQLNDMLRINLLSEEQSSLISKNKLKDFLSSDIAKRMHLAAKDDNLWIEQPFVLQESPKNLFDDVSDNLDDIIIQGIIDVFFKEDDGIVLLDYKTDKISDEEELIKRYKAQIDLYAKAIEKFTHLSVKEKVLYSFCLDKAVEL
ncbi:MAG: helicase-exonuclease AddAB subunit AddA [Lachnospiraceae bacterium]|nr:helicase-exonuclease AddAB subunit AddA [Lachnospiraceae bacterium]